MIANLCRAMLTVLVLAMAGTQAAAQTSPSPYTKGIRYDAMNRVTGTIAPDPDGTGAINYAAVRNTYDAAGRLIKVEKGELSSWKSEAIAPSAWTGFTIFETTDTTYNNTINRKTRETVKNSSGVLQSVTDYEYDGLGRLLCTAVRMNSSSWATVTAGCTPQSPPPNGPDDRITKNVYDIANQLLQVREGVMTSVEAAEVTYSYTDNGKRQFVIDGNGNRAKLVYNGQDRLYQWIFPSTTMPASYDDSTQATALATAGAINTGDYEQYLYDENGNRTSFRKRDNSTLGYHYDFLNRLDQKTVPARADLTAAQTRDVYYTYDYSGNALTAKFDSLTGADGVTNTYTGFNELQSSTIAMSGFSKALTSSYDCDGNRTKLIHPENTATYTFAYGYDGLDRLSRAYQSGTVTGTCSPAVSGTSAEAFTYGSDGFVSNRSEGSGGSSVAYDWDDLGRLHTQTDSFSGTTGTNSWTLNYNGASQIGTEVRSNNAYAWLGAAPVNRGYTPNGLNQYSVVAGKSFTYDANGNLTSDAVWTYLYDIENRLVKATAGTTTVNLTYDPLGRLFQVVKAQGSTTVSDTRFVYDGDALVLEYNSSGAVTNRYVHGSNSAADDPYVWYAGATLATRRSLHADHEGSIVGIADSSGANYAINTYDEYGNPVYDTNLQSTNTGRFQYTGQAWIGELNLYYYKARFYSPSLGRFLQTDPIGYDGGVNLYGYVGDDPVNHADPTGNATNQADEAPVLCPARNQQGGCHDVTKQAQQQPQKGVIGKAVDWVKKNPGKTAVGVAAVIGTAACVIAEPCGLGEAIVGGTAAAAETGEAVAGAETAANVANAARLAKQLQSEAGVAEITSGGGRTIAGTGSGVPLRSATRLANEFGGKPGDWVKVTSTAEGQMQTHAYRNLVTGRVVEFKSKLP